MSTQNNNMQPQQNSQQAAREEHSNDSQKSSEISLPKIDRPEGPFEHSGETARMTEEERQEKADESNQSSDVNKS
jgi:hypothetical protein